MSISRDTYKKSQPPKIFAWIDIQIEITPLSFDELSRTQPGEHSSVIRERVTRARQIQEERYREYPGIYCNARHHQSNY